MRRTTEDYLKTVYLLAKKQGGVRGVEIAEQLGVSKPTVSVVVKRLLRDGFVTMDSSHEIFLTDEGKAVAEAVLERNATFKQLLEELGVDRRIAAKDACEMEHAISPEGFEALKRMMEERRKKQDEG